MRLSRSSLRTSMGRVVLPLGALLALGLGAACGGGGAAAPTPTSVPATSVAPALAPSPARPQFASPVPSPSAATAAATATATVDAGSTEYEVASGDTLLVIAEKTYGDATQWRRIYDANKDAIGSDPDKLKVGMKLKIPPKQS